MAFVGWGGVGARASLISTASICSTTSLISSLTTSTGSCSASTTSTISFTGSTSSTGSGMTSTTGSGASKIYSIFFLVLKFLNNQFETAHKSTGPLSEVISGY